MPLSQPTWTAERIELLKNRFEAGLSCREIANDIGVSRNSVIGKLSRLNLTRDKPPGTPRPSRRDGAKGPRPKSIPRLQYQMLRKLYSEPQLLADREPISNDACCSLQELSEERCRWPIGHPGTTDFRFCGITPVDSLPYCLGHTRLAYRPGSRQRAARG